MRVVMLLWILLAAACTPSAEGIVYPVNYRADFLHYVTVDRPDATVRDIYINPEAVEHLRRGNRLPDDTIIVVEAYHAALDEDGEPLLDELGRYIKAAPMAMVHVAQKRSNWSEADFPSAARAGAWNFGSFTFGDGTPFDEDLTACFNCHQATLQTDFVYSGQQLSRFAVTDATQYFFCELRRRTPC